MADNSAQMPGSRPSDIMLSDIEAATTTAQTDEPATKMKWWKRPLQHLLHKPESFGGWLLAIVTAILIAPFVILAAVILKVLDLALAVILAPLICIFGPCIACFAIAMDD